MRSLSDVRAAKEAAERLAQCDVARRGSLDMDHALRKIDVASAKRDRLLDTEAAQKQQQHQSACRVTCSEQASNLVLTEFPWQDDRLWQQRW